MARKISFKIFSLFFSCWILLILSACIIPVDIQTFMDSDEVKIIIESTKKPDPSPPSPPSVNIDPDSDDFSNLTAGDRSISGLTSGKYYMAEESDEEGVFTRNIFIQPDGDNWGDLSEIGRLTGNKISNLKNDYTYKVKSAKQFADTAYKYFIIGTDATEKTSTAVNGKLTIIGKDDYYLNLEPVINANKNYEVMKLPNIGWNGNSRASAYYNVTGNVFQINETTISQYIIDNESNKNKEKGIFQYRDAVSTGAVSLQNKSIIKLDGINTQSEYIFAEYDNKKPVTNFTFLLVERLDNIASVSITVGVGFTQEYTPTVECSNANFNQTANTFSFTLKVTNGTGYTFVFKNEQGDTIGTSTGTDATGVITFSLDTDVNWWQGGIHVITLEATRTADNKIYTGTINITCTP